MTYNGYKTAHSEAIAKLYRRPPEEYFRIVREKFPTLEASGEYLNNRSKINVKCTECGNEWTTDAYTLMYGKGCPKCRRRENGIKSRKTHDQYIKDLKNVNPNIKILNTYITAKTRMECKCSVCGHEWNAAARNLLSGFGCPECAKIRVADSCRSSKLELEEKLKAAKSNVIVVGNYINSKTNILCECPICHNRWMATPENLLQGTSCPRCRKSRGEVLIEKFLIDNNIEYAPQKKYEDLTGVGGAKLSYDFFLPKYNILLEYQGVQHERPVTAFGGEEYFATQKEHDRLKKEYAKNHSIKLIEIWYYDIKNIDSILNSILIMDAIA